MSCLDFMTGGLGVRVDGSVGHGEEGDTSLKTDSSEALAGAVQGADVDLQQVRCCIHELLRLIFAAECLNDTLTGLSSI